MINMTIIRKNRINKQVFRRKTCHNLLRSEF